MYDRVDDLDAHLDILSYCPDKPFVCIVNSHPDTPSCHLSRWSPHLVLNKNCKNFVVGPLLAFCHGLRACEGCEYAVYRNADDWLFNHQSVLDRIAAMASLGSPVGAYNWLSVGTMNDFAMNELTCHVPTFLPWVDSMEDEFANSSPAVLCEAKIARWVRRLGGDKLYRLPGREQSPGVGYELESLQELLRGAGVRMTSPMKRLFDDNNRYFNRKWQLLGHHDNQQRGQAYARLRHEIVYHRDLEGMPAFSRWLDSWVRGLEWNLPSAAVQFGKAHTHGQPIRKISFCKLKGQA